MGKRKPAFLLENDHAYIKELAEADDASITQTLHSILVFVKVHGINSVTDLRRNHVIQKCIQSCDEIEAF